MKTRAVVLTAIVLAVAGCSGDDDSEPTSTTVAGVETTAESSTSSTSATTASTSSTSMPSTAPPTTANPGTTSTLATTVPGTTDWAATVQTLGQRRQDLYASPDVARIREVCAEESPCAEQLNVQLADLASKGWRVVGTDPYTVVSARLEDFDGDALETALVVTLIVVVERPENGGTIVDSNGATVAAVDPETPAGMNTENRTILGRSGPPEDPWRIISQERIREVPA
jgi:hypothetical protein